MYRILLALSIMLLSQVGHAQSSKNVTLLCNWQDTTNAPVNAGGQHWNDVWGISWKGKEYAVIGGTNGAHIIDVDNCKELGFLPGRSKGVIHRDYKTYGHYLYAVSDEGFSTLQVFDFSNLPDTPRLVWEVDPKDLSRAHNIFIDTAKAMLYAASTSTIIGSDDHLQVYSLRDPVHPELVAVINDFDNTHDIYVRNDTAWCSNSSMGYLVLNMSTLPQYKVIGGLVNYPHRGYNHSSWMGYDYIGVMADETFGKPLKVIDARNPEVIEVLSSFGPRGTDTTSVPHNPYLLGHYAFISYYMDGLQIYDLRDPYHPVQAGFYDTYPGANGQKFAGAWGVFPYLPSRRVLVSDMQTGLYVFDVSKAIPGLSTGALPGHESMQIFPNPAVNKIHVQLPGGTSGHINVAIYTVLGAVALQLEHDMRSSNPSLEVSLPADLPPGSYVLRAAIGGHSFTARFTKR